MIGIDLTMNMKKYIQLIKQKTVGKPAYAKFIYERWRDGK